MVIEDLKLYVLLSMLCLWWLVTDRTYPLFDIMSYLVVGFSCYCIPFDGMFMIKLIWVYIYPLEVFQMVYHCLPYSPFQWPFHPNLGLWFLTSLMRFFSEGDCPKMFMRLRTILPRIFKSLSFRLIGFWRLWLFKYPLNFTLYFPTLK